MTAIRNQMSYQVLARKWRPKSFQQLMGQEHVVTVLTNALEQQRLHHAYLFTGTRGVGKTTIARIFAKSLNCDLGVTATPCGQCETCQDIDLGRFVDLLEIDAASRTKVDDTREILDNVQYAPTRGRYKVYLIDEVHMLSRSSFNALLKTLEEPPEHVKFILATTDPQKLPVTVLSRCLQFHLKALSVTQIEQQLKTILVAEQVTFDNSAITLLAKAARGSMRDSLSLTDQAIAQGQGNINVANVQQMLGCVDNNWVFKLLISLLKQDAQALMDLSLEIASYAPNYGRLLAEFIQLLHQIAMAQVVKQHFDLSPEHNQLLEKFCLAMSPEDVQLYYQIVLNGRKDLPYAADEQAAFDMVLLRLLAFKPQQMAIKSSDITSTDVTIDFNSTALPNTEINKAEVKATNDVSVAVDNPNVQLTEKIEHSQLQQLAEEVIDEKTTDVQRATSSIEQELNTQILEVERVAQHMAVIDKGSSASTQSSVTPQERFNHQSVQASSEHSHAYTTIDQPEQSASAASDQISISQPEQKASTSNNQVSIEQTDQKTNASNNQVSMEQVDQQTSASSAQVSINQPEQIVSSQNNQETSPLSAIETVLANRNMLRSRKKALEDEGKKPSGAIERQPSDRHELAQKELKEKTANVPDIKSVPEQPFSPEIINPAQVKLANQVDKWANMIDNMALNGRLRQLAIHSTICKSSTDEVLVLRLDQATRHLKTEAAHKQLESHLSQLLDKKITVELELVEYTKDDPFQIQTHINDKRYDYAKELLAKDEIVLAMQHIFQAEMDENSIMAR